MKALRILLTASIACTAPTFGSTDPFYGIEALSGYRSSYIYRGFDVADGLLEFQLETEISANQQTIISAGTSLASESNGGFSLFDFYLDARYEVGDLTLGAIASYREFRGSFIESGFDFGVFALYQWNESFDSKLNLHYDFGNEASYASFDTRWSVPLNKSTFSYVEAGVSWVDDYLENDGLQDLSGKAGLTFNINDKASVSPYLAISIPFEDTQDTSVYAGFWFAFLF